MRDQLLVFFDIGLFEHVLRDFGQAPAHQSVVGFVFGVKGVPGVDIATAAIGDESDAIGVPLLHFRRPGARPVGRNNRLRKDIDGVPCVVQEQRDGAGGLALYADDANLGIGRPFEIADISWS